MEYLKIVVSIMIEKMSWNLLGTIPEGVSKLCIVFDCHGIDDSSDLEWAFLELHDAGVVDAGPLRKYQDWQFGGILHMFFQSATSSALMMSTVS